MPTMPPLPAVMPLKDASVPQQTLQDLEQTVKLAEQTVPPPADMGTARDAILNAIDSVHEPRLEPIAALNSQQLGPDLSHVDHDDQATPIISVAEPQEEIPGVALVMPDLPKSSVPAATKLPVSDPTAPPPVPPPMMPPLQ